MVIDIDLDKIIANNKIQDRSEIQIDESLIKLSKSIKEQGLIHPITVTEVSEGMYQVVCGQRRIIACKMIGKTKISCIVKSFNSNIEELMNIFDENSFRKKINIYDENFLKMKIIYVQLLKDKHEDKNLTFDSKFNNDIIDYFKKIKKYYFAINFKKEISKEELLEYEIFNRNCQQSDINSGKILRNFFLLNTSEEIVSFIKESKITLSLAFKLHKLKNEPFFEELMTHLKEKEEIRISDIESFFKIKPKNTGKVFDKEVLIENIKRASSKKQLKYLQKINTEIEKMLKLESIKRNKNENK